MSGDRQVIRLRKGTAVSNTYQKTGRRAEPDRLPGEMTIPEQVVVSMAEIAESAKEGLLALAVGTGLQVMAAMFAEDAVSSGATGLPLPSTSACGCGHSRVASSPRRACAGEVWGEGRTCSNVLRSLMRPPACPGLRSAQ